jgi:peptidoglycan/xylan/chitin deacetylase (PgdA/CDA1 family)
MRVPVLLYHSVSDAADARFSQWVVSPEQFAAQMDHLAREGYRTVTVSELAGLLWDRPDRSHDRVVAITFDDGFADFHTNAWPSLRRHGFNATVFVTTGFVGATSVWLEQMGEGERPMMSWDELAEVAAGGIELGAHGHTHLQLDVVSRPSAGAEIRRSRCALSELVGPPQSFAYPHGYHTRAVRREVRGAGFMCACAVGDGLAGTSDQRFAITRAIVRAGTTLDAFAEIADARGPVRRSRPLRRAAWRAVRRAGWETRVEQLRGALSGEAG